MNSGLLGIVAALSWGSADFAARFSGRALGPINALLGMLVSGTILLTFWVWYTDMPFIWQWSDAWLLVLSGVTTMLATLFVYKAISIGPISVAAPLLASYPALVVLASITKGIFPTLWQVGGIIAVMAGVILVARAEVESHKSDVKTDTDTHGPSVITVALTGSILLAVAITSGQAAAIPYGDLEATWIGRVISLTAILILFLLPRNKISLPLKWWPIVAAQGLLDSMAYLVTFAGGNTPNPEITAVIGSSFGCVTVFLAWVFLKERIALPQWLGIAMVIGGAATLSLH